MWPFYLLQTPVVNNASEYRRKLSIAAYTYLFIVRLPNVAALPPFADSCDLHLLFPSTITSSVVVLVLRHHCLSLGYAPGTRLAGGACRKGTLTIKHLRMPHIRAQRFRQKGSSLLLPRHYRSRPSRRSFRTLHWLTPNLRPSSHRQSLS
jgi:hypothetical protein